MNPIQAEQSGTDWTQFMMGVNDAALSWYSTVTQKPIAREQPNSIMGILTGTDYGANRAYGQITNPLGGGVVMIAAIVLLVVLIKR